ncbi:hypothetical protein VPH35_086230 [Triticum aestivum]
MTSMLSAFSSWFVNPRRNPLARIHMLTISNRLKNYGLRYDDLYDPYFDLDIKEALCRLPREVVDARHQRLKRAMDLSMKHQYLPDDVRVRPSPCSLPPRPLICADLSRFACPRASGLWDVDMAYDLPDRSWPSRGPVR